MAGKKQRRIKTKKAPKKTKPVHDEVDEDESDEMEEIRASFAGCALTQEEAEALGFPTPYHPDDYD